ncbi:MAG TPA: metal ABC transporter ATP-binding protein [Clostridia bacterium]|nr:metal ABC transporter ATP-binding protein [Clostridia bacterium]
MKKIVSLRDVSFSYEQDLILDNINLEINEGDYLGIVGPNGSGKTTLLKLMLNILQPLKGKIELFGQDIQKFKDWHKIGYVAQKAVSFNLGFPATVEEVVAANLSTGLGLFKPLKKNHLEKIVKALQVVKMQDYRKRLIGNLSGGQQQRVFIARAIVNSPEIIFLDEPTMGIDLNSQTEFYELMEKLNKEMKITIVMISHDIGVITEKVNRLVCVGNKKVVVHDNNSKLPADEILTELYGEKMKILIHYH